MPTNADRLLLLADHIKLSLLERNRAITLKLEPNTADAYITRSLETLRQGIEQIEQEQTRLEQQGDLYVSILFLFPPLYTQYSGVPYRPLK